MAAASSQSHTGTKRMLMCAHSCSPALTLPLSPGRVELLPRFGSQVVFAQQEAGRHGSCTQTGQQNSRAAAGHEARERVCHPSALLSCLKPLS